MSREVLRRRARTVRRRILARRRLLAATFAAIAVGLGLQTVRPAPLPSTAVVVAARDLPAGTTIAADDVRTISLADDAVPAGVDPDPVGEVLSGPMRAGEPITDRRVLGAPLLDGYPDRVAMPVRLPDDGMVELLQIGDRVDLVAADPQSGGAEVIATSLAVVLIPRLSEAASGLPGRLVVLAVPEIERAAIADAAARQFLTYSFSG